MIKRIILPFMVIFSLLISLSVKATDYPNVPKPFQYVSDYTQTLSPSAHQQLEKALVNYGQKTSSQIAVVIVPTTNGEDVADYSFNLFNKWGIGRKKENNGVLLLVAKDDHKLFIVVGRGLEAALPDAIAATIIRHNIVPFFKQNRYAEGIASGLSAIIKATQGEYAPPKKEKEDPFDGFFIFLGVAFILFVLFNIIGKKSHYISPSHLGGLGSMTHFHRSNSFGNSFGSSGGFGSGGGFGGGNSGGGGAGGSW